MIFPGGILSEKDQKQLTVSADEALTERAHEVADEHKRSVDDELCDRLEISGRKAEGARVSFREFLASMPKVSLPRKYSREEMNERR